jgi:peptidoglycan/LPS O-acetylase OafA/YrhL
MKLFTTIFERVPFVWFLLGLLFMSAGLYLGFENGLTFVYLIVGAFCCAFGIALFVFRFQERPKTRSANRLSPHFISTGASASMPSAPPVES